jgi:hypothetical protein
MWTAQRYYRYELHSQMRHEKLLLHRSRGAVMGVI